MRTVKTKIQDYKSVLPTLLTMVLIVLTLVAFSINSWPLVLVALIGMILQFFWLIGDRQVWLATVTAVAFLTVVLITTKSLF